jgi:hypothetical protein
MGMVLTDEHIHLESLCGTGASDNVNSQIQFLIGCDPSPDPSISSMASSHDRMALRAAVFFTLVEHE